MMQKPKILAADNTKVALRYMETILGDIYDVTLVQTGMSVLDCLKSEIPDLILMNANMFGMDGYEVLRRIKEDKETKEIPVILMTSEKDTQSELRRLEESAVDFISLPFEPQVLKARIAHIVELSVLRKQQAHLIAKQKEQIDRLFLQLMVTIAHTVDAKDRYARRHSLRVALYCRGIASKLGGYTDKEKEALYYIALLHDIGKVSTPDTILNKASGLTKEEYENVKKHAEIGAQIVQNTRFVPGLEEGVRYHHEWYDGNGYLGICGDDIPEVSRIIAVADAYEAMTADRAEGELKGEGELNEANELLRQVFTETVLETQSELERDSLTDFLNRRYFEDKINNYLLSSKSCGTFFMMDLDNFKQVNDTYGHKTGDELIQAFADVIRENTRDDDFVCRMGGDEFAVFFFELEEERVICKRAESIIKDFAKIRTEMGCSMCSVSIGIMTKYYGGEELDCEQLYEKADQALYYVKNNGKDAYHLFESMPEDLKNNRQTGCQMDLDQLMRQVTERKYRPGAYAVEYDRFSFIYQFIARNVERNGQHVQVILLSMELPKDREISLERMEDSLVLLESAIVRSLRRGDVTSRFSSTQQVVVLMDASKEDGVMVANRILKKYNTLAKEAAITARFDIVEVPHAFSKRTEKNEEKA